jgi:hypothetical protein
VLLAVLFEGEDEGAPSANKSAPAPTVNIEGSLTNEEALNMLEPSNEAAKTACTSTKAPHCCLFLHLLMHRKLQLPNCIQHINQGKEEVSAQWLIAVSAPASTSTNNVAMNKDVAKGATVSTQMPPATGLPVKFSTPGLVIKKVEDIGKDPGEVFAALVAIGVEGMQPVSMIHACEAECTLMTSNGLLSAFKPNSIPLTLHVVLQINFTLEIDADGILKSRFLWEESMAKDKVQHKRIEVLNTLLVCLQPQIADCKCEQDQWQ